MPRRKIKAKEAPKMSKSLSGLMKNRFGWGGLKLGGGEKEGVVEDETPNRGVSSLEVTAGVSADDLT